MHQCFYFNLLNQLYTAVQFSDDVHTERVTWAFNILSAAFFFYR